MTIEESAEFEQNLYEKCNNRIMEKRAGEMNLMMERVSKNYNFILCNESSTLQMALNLGQAFIRFYNNGVDGQEKDKRNGLNQSNILLTN